MQREGETPWLGKFGCTMNQTIEDKHGKTMFWCGRWTLVTWDSFEIGGLWIQQQETSLTCAPCFHVVADTLRELTQPCGCSSRLSADTYFGVVEVEEVRSGSLAVCVRLSGSGSRRVPSLLAEKLPADVLRRDFPIEAGRRKDMSLANDTKPRDSGDKRGSERQPRK